ncbi:MAG: PsbP-related protein, partial [Candidatus Staskawiczbacteria bacterium]|nr:PsbP-related protein [Candidatus Staskawiczbacteria bacterium]
TYTSNELKYSFKYPADWKVIPNYAYSAAGFGGLVGYTITTSNSKTPPDNERIDIGGAQVDCASLSNLNRQEHPTGVLCKKNYPVYTFSTDPKVISVFNIIANSISDIKPTIPTDQTANWKTYTNTKYGFSIKYPPNFSVTESGRPDEVVLFINNDKSINISQIQFGLALGASGPIPFEQYVQDAQSETVTDFSKGGVVRFLNTSSGSITYEVIGAPTHIPSVETVIKYVNGNTNEAITLDINGQNAIDIKKLENKDYSDFADLEKINSEMVSTFKFTNSTTTNPSTNQTAGWQTYTNNDLGLSFEYPQEWGEPQSNLLSTSTKISFSNNSNIDLSEGVYYNQNLGRNMIFDQIKNSFSNIFPAGNLKSQKNITIGGKEGVEFLYSGSNSSGLSDISIFVPVDQNNTIAEIDFSYKISDGTIDNFNNFLSNFKFTK